MKRTFRITLLFILIFIAFNNTPAQTLNNQVIIPDKPQISLSYDKDFHSSNFTYSAFSGVYQLYFNIPLSSNYNLVGDIPFINTSYEAKYNFFYYNYSYKYEQNGLGNIFIGMQTYPEFTSDARSIITFGVYLPTAYEKASFSGLFSNYTNLPKFIPNYLSLYMNYAYLKNADAFTFGVEAGPTFMIPTKEGNSESELLIHFGFNAGYQVERFLFNAEFQGIAIVTSEVQTFDDRFVNLINLGAHWKGERIIPSLFYKIYLNKDIRKDVTGILGIGVSVNFP